MNRVFTIVGLSIGAIILMANSGGRGSIGGETLTGAPGEGGNSCGKVGCHSAGAFDAGATVELADAMGNLIDDYEIGVEYTVRITPSFSGTPAGYGFQMVAVAENETNAGDWGDLPDGVQELTLLEKSYIEQGQTLTGPSVEIPWTPTEDQGEITFYYVINVVNGNGSTSGDGVLQGSYTTSLMGSSNTDELREERLSVFPNPTADLLNIENSKADKVAIYNAQGKCISHLRINANSSIDVSMLESGLYFLKAEDQNKLAKFIKI